MSFLPHQCHSFRVTVIPSVLLSFLPDYCHSFCISVIPSKYCHSFQIIQKITNTNQLQTFPYLKGEKNGHRRWPYMRVNSRPAAPAEIYCYDRVDQRSFTDILQLSKALVLVTATVLEIIYRILQLSKALVLVTATVLEIFYRHFVAFKSPTFGHSNRARNILTRFCSKSPNFGQSILE